MPIGDRHRSFPGQRARRTIRDRLERSTILSIAGIPGRVLPVPGETLDEILDHPPGRTSLDRSSTARDALVLILSVRSGSTDDGLGSASCRGEAFELFDAFTLQQPSSLDPGVDEPLGRTRTLLLLGRLVVVLFNTEERGDGGTSRMSSVLLVKLEETLVDRVERLVQQVRDGRIRVGDHPVEEEFVKVLTTPFGSVFPCVSAVAYGSNVASENTLTMALPCSKGRAYSKTAK